MSVTYPVIRMTIGGGQVLEFSGEQVISATLIEEINPISVELPISTIEFKIISYDESFSMFSGEYFQLLSERLPMLVYERVFDENQNPDDRFLGKFYLETWKNVSDYEFEFCAIDIIGVMAATDFDGRFWSVPTTLETILAQVLNPIDVPYELDTSIEDIERSGWIPPGDYRKALQQICFSAGVMASTSRSQKLIVSPIILPSGVYDSEITDAQKSIEQSIELTPLITSIELVSHNYSQGLVIGDVFEEYLAAGSHKIVFEKPYYDILVDGPGYTPLVLATEGGDYLVTENSDYIEVGGAYVFGPNSLYLELSEGGNVKVTGYPWLDSKRAYTFTETGVSEFANKKSLKIEDATMVNIANAQMVLNQVRDYYRQRYMQSIKLLPSNIKTGDMVLTTAVFQKKINAIVQKMNIDLTGGYLAKTDILGIESVYIEPADERRPRTNVAICGVELMRQNGWREYA